MRKALVVLLALGAACLLAPVSSFAAQAAPIVLNVATFFPPQHAQAQALDAWGKEIEKRTGGKVKIMLHAGGTLGKGPEIIDNVINGVADVGNSCFAYTRGRFPVMEAVDLPMGYPNGMVASRVADAFAHQVNPPELADVKLLYVHAHGPGLLHTKKPVKTLADIKGMKIRATGLSAKVIEALGGIPVAKEQGEAYEALQTGVVEGNITPIESLKGWKQAEVIKSTTDCFSVGYTTAMFVVMNKDKWNKLPADVQKVIEQVSAEWVSVHGAAWDKADADGRAFTKEKGNQIVTLSADESAKWRKAVDPVISGYAKKSKNNAGYVKKVQELIKHYSSSK